MKGQVCAFVWWCAVITFLFFFLEVLLVLSLFLSLEMLAGLWLLEVLI